MTTFWRWPPHHYPLAQGYWVSANDVQVAATGEPLAEPCADVRGGWLVPALEDEPASIAELRRGATRLGADEVELP